jgi:hypothetical protein
MTSSMPDMSEGTKTAEYLRGEVTEESLLKAALPGANHLAIGASTPS